MNRQTIARQLMVGCPGEALCDHEAIASAIRRGETRETILGMREANAWPETYVWLKNNLS